MWPHLIYSKTGYQISNSSIKPVPAANQVSSYQRAEKTLESEGKEDIGKGERKRQKRKEEREK